MRIAVLDDDISQLDLVSHTLTSAGHHVHGFERGRDLVRQLQRDSFDLLILDWQVPDMSGTEVLAWARDHQKANVPVLFMTLRSAEEDIVNALNAGADDYMIKPLRRGELMARVQALLRRAYPRQAEEAVFVFNQFEFDEKRMVVRRDQEIIAVTQKEFYLALLFFRNLGRPLSRSHILESVWGRDSEIPSRTMDTHVSRIRSKLNIRPDQGFRLTPVYSYGYRLERVSSAPLTSNAAPS